MTKQELIKKLETRLYFAQNDISAAANGIDKDMAIAKKIYMCQVLELVQRLDDPQSQPPQEPCNCCEKIINADIAGLFDGEEWEVNCCIQCGRKLMEEKE